MKKIIGIIMLLIILLFIFKFDLLKPKIIASYGGIAGVTEVYFENCHGFIFKKSENDDDGFSYTYCIGIPYN